MTNHQISLQEVTPAADMRFEPLDRRYKSAHIAGVALIYVFLMGLALLLLLTDEAWICLTAECVIAAVFIANMIFLPASYLYKGYAFREHDLSYRSGIVCPTITTVPYSRIQQVSVKQNIVARAFRLYSVEIVNGAQTMSSVRIPGLSKEKALRIKDFITDKLDRRHD